MPTWKVLFIAVLFCICLALAFATVIYPTTKEGGVHPWFWGSVLLGATGIMAGMFVLVLRRASAAMR
jgi:hypothetical protein